jgi:prophage DNA circulation protein
LVIAYNLYGDSKRAEEILARNPQIVHPSLVPGGEALEILSP